MSPKVGIVLDNPKRDLRGVALLAHELTKQGASAYIIPNYNQYYEVPLLGLDAMVATFVRLTNRDQLKAIRELGTLVYVLDTEGGLLSKEGPRSADGWAQFTRSAGLHEAVDGYFFWGSALHEGFRRHSGIPEDRLFVTGTPRYDITHSKWRSLLRHDRRDFVLVNSNFAGVNPKFTRSVDFEIKMAREAGLDLQLIKDILRDQKQIMDRFLESILTIASENRDQTFVFRSHPFEGEEIYRETFKDLKNVIVESRDEVFDVASRASYLIHVNCTTAVDAYFLRVPSVSLNYLNTPLMADYMPVPTLVSYDAKSLDDLRAVVRDPTLLRGQVEKADQHRPLIETMFGRLDGRAAERVAATLIEQVKRQGRTPKRDVVKSITMCQESPRWKQIAQGVFVNLVGGETVNNLRAKLNPLRLDKSVSFEDLQRLLARIQELDDSGGKRYAVEKARHPFNKFSLGSVRTIG